LQGFTPIVFSDDDLVKFLDAACGIGGRWQLTSDGFLELYELPTHAHEAVPGKIFADLAHKLPDDSVWISASPRSETLHNIEPDGVCIPTGKPLRPYTIFAVNGPPAVPFDNLVCEHAFSESLPHVLTKKNVWLSHLTTVQTVIIMKTYPKSRAMLAEVYHRGASDAFYSVKTWHT
jgi:hypothetical protein